MWKTLNISINNVVTETSKAILINMPHKSDYDGYSFWHPSKLVNEGRNSNALNIAYCDNFKFKLKKYGKGRYNSNTVISELEITVDEFEEAFGIIDSNITEKKVKEIPVLEIQDVDVIPDLVD